jgi:hypothetical protein
MGSSKSVAESTVNFPEPAADPTLDVPTLLADPLRASLAALILAIIGPTLPGIFQRCHRSRLGEPAGCTPVMISIGTLKALFFGKDMFVCVK